MVKNLDHTIPYHTWNFFIASLLLSAVSRSLQRTEPLCFFLSVLPIAATDQTREDFLSVGLPIAKPHSPICTQENSSIEAEHVFDS
jgi:hypothetical protein